MRTVTRSVALAFAAGLTAGVIAGCQVYDFAPVRPLVISSQDMEVDVIARALKPNMMLLVDKSQSMDVEVTTGVTRWDELQGAMGTFLQNNGAIARMGLATFPNVISSGVGQCGVVDAGSGLPYDTTKAAKIRIPIADLDDGNTAGLQAHANNIRQELSAINETDSDPNSSDFETLGGTPTGFSVRLVSELPALNSEREDLILLLTDGLPNCNPDNPYTGADTTNCKCTQASCTGTFERLGCLDASGAASHVAAARARGIRTIVIGFGAETGAGDGPDALNAMAIAGGFARRCDDNADCPVGDSCNLTTNECNQTKFYQAANQAELVQVLNAIAGELDPTPCEFNLTQDPQNYDSRFVVVYMTEPGQDTVKLLPGPDTWEYIPPAGADGGTATGNGKVMLLGRTCDVVSQATAANPVRISIRIVSAL